MEGMNDMDWNSFIDGKRRQNEPAPSIKIETKKVAVPRNRMRKLPDGTTIVVDKPKSADK